MSSYSELVKNFEKIRGYMREFYVYGFQSGGVGEGVTESDRRTNKVLLKNKVF